MNSVLFDAAVRDETRRGQLYEGQLFVYSACPNALALVHCARELIRDAFGKRDPETAQFTMPVEEYAALLADLKPRFVHHPRAKECIQGMLRELGCDLTRTYFDVPRMRTATSDNYLTSGIAYAFHPHRDTWYSAPFCQLNFWLPIFDIAPENAMAFHPRYWDEAVRNGSASYDYYEWNKNGRATAAQHVKSDTRQQPKAEEPLQLDPQIRLIPPVGGTIVFSAAQMHSTVPNTSGRTRFSIDFRTVHLDDVIARRGAPNVDSACTGTTLRDYQRGSDLARIPEELCLLYDREPQAIVNRRQTAPRMRAVGAL